MRVLYATHSLPFGRGEAFIIPEIRGLIEMGHDVLVVPMHPSGSVLHNDAQIIAENFVARQPIVSFRVVWSAVKELFRAPARALSLFGQLLGARTHLQKLKNSIVFPKGLWLSWVAREWEADIIHAHWAAGVASMALVASEMSGIPWMLTAHRYDIDEDNLLALKVKKACFVRTISESGRKAVLELAGPYADKVRVIRMGVDIPSNIVAASKRSAELRLVFPANLKEVKGHIYLLKAITILREKGLGVRVDLAGDGALRDVILKFVQDEGLEGLVRYLGVVPHEQLLKQLSKGIWDALVLPSVVTASGAKEGVPVSLIEAMSYGIPVISTTTGGIPELLSGGAGLMVPEKNPQALANAIESLLQNPSLREKLGRKGRSRIEQEFSIDEVLVEIVEEMKKCAEKCFPEHCDREYDA